MARGDSINSLLQMQAYRRAEMEGQIAKRDVYGETKAFVEQWRKNNGLEGTKALPNRNEVPFQWMLPFLDKVETQDTKPSPIANQGMMIAGVPNFPGGGFTTTSGAFVDLSGEAYYLDNGELIPEGGYDPAIHGDLIPGGGPGTDRVMNKKNNNMLIAGGKKSDEQRAYEDFVKDSGSQPLDEQLMDMDKGRMGGGLDILDDLLFTDTV